MPILRLNADETALRLHASPAAALPALRSASRGLGPVIIMIHGFKYDPGHAECNPHSTIFAFSKRPDRTQDILWPRHLGFGTGTADEGLAIAFAWPARGHIWTAQRSAIAAGGALATTIRAIRTAAPQRPVHVITHSMGSEVAFEALGHLPAHSIRRLIVLTGASYASRAYAALQTPAGQSLELINVTSRENDLFDFMFERLIAPPQKGDRAMSQPLDCGNVLNIQLDCARTLAALAPIGGDIAPPTARVCHWSGYTRPGALRFYANLMRAPDETPLATLKVMLPDTTSPRWSRILAYPAVPNLLPDPRKIA